jgi:hypothetical protein
VVTADAPSTITPRGLVQFTRDSDVLGTVALDGSGIASFDAPPRTTGSEIYYAFFLTNDDFVGSDDDDEHSGRQVADRHVDQRGQSGVARKPCKPSPSAPMSPPSRPAPGRRPAASSSAATTPRAAPSACPPQAAI